MRRPIKKTKNFNTRYRILAVILAVVLVLYTFRSASLQIFNSAEYKAQASGVSIRTAAIKAPRGEIVDYYGRPLATNREGYNIVFYSAYIDKDNLNNTIVTLMRLLSNNNLSWNDDLPIKYSNGKFSFTDKSTAVAKLKKNLKLADYATVGNCMDALIEKYVLQGKDPAMQRRIAGVRYTMDAADFSISYPYTFAEDVTPKVMAEVSESGFYLKGVMVEVSQFREYSKDSVAPHIVGSVGPIYAETWNDYKDDGYSYGDKVGVSGIEAQSEDYLRGKDGEITYTLDASGKVLSSEVTKAPVAGNTVKLTIDKTIQIAAQKALKDVIQKCNADKVYVNAASAVVLNIKTGGVMAAATNPTYTYADLDDEKTLEKLQKDKTGKPFFNRAFNGAYPPGSVFKPAVAAVALQLNKITTTDTIYCNGIYDFFPVYKPKCMGHHGYISLNRAIAKSCNIYFYELGRRVGIKELNKYCRYFGLGEKTGIEISESAGTLAGPDEKEFWYDGDTVQAAIGQSDNAFTPLQLATYASTIANNGVRYKTTLISKVLNYEQSKVVLDNKPVVMQKINFKSGVLDAVKKGMLSVTEDGTGSTLFKNYPIKIGGKTGTAQVTGKKDHTVFICFAPFDNPEIAVAVLIEHGQFGKYSGSVVNSILNAYFYTQIAGYTTQTTENLLN